MTDGPEGGPPSSPRAVRRRRAQESAGLQSGKIAARPAVTRPKPARSRLRWGLALAALAASLGAGAASRLGYFQPAPPPHAPAQRPLPSPSVATLPALVLPPLSRDRSLPRGYPPDLLGETRAVLGKRHHAITTAPADTGLDLRRAVTDPLVASVGYSLLASQVCRIAASYRADCPYDDRESLRRATAVYGKPAGNYFYRAPALHTVTFWEDARTLLKLDCLQTDAERRLSRLEILDKAAAVARATAQPKRPPRRAPKSAPPAPLSSPPTAALTKPPAATARPAVTPKPRPSPPASPPTTRPAK